TLARLGPARLWQRPEARTLRSRHRRPARAASHVGAGAVGLGPGRDLRSRLRRGGGRALGPASGSPAILGAIAQWREVSGVSDAVPAPRFLPGHGAAMGLDARPSRQRRCAEPLRIYGGRKPAV